jgi:hypothetical protein
VSGELHGALHRRVSETHSRSEGGGEEKDPCP